MTTGAGVWSQSAVLLSQVFAVNSQIHDSLSDVHSFKSCPKHRIWYHSTKVSFSKLFYFRNPHDWLEFFSAFLSTEVNFCDFGQHDCEHECINMEESLVCKCHPGYTLQHDGNTCRNEYLMHCSN